MSEIQRRWRVDLIAGARPNFMKVAPIIRAIEAKQAAGIPLDYRLVHTGQHYDARMSGDFFEQLGIPAPHVNLEVGSGTQAQQTAAIMTGYEALLLKDRSDICLVVGDVNSTMACSIAAKKLGLPVAHVEGGIRSGDWGMPEEVNRVVTDSISNYFFTTSDFANKNLKAAGFAEDSVYFVGNTMIDTLLTHMPRFEAPAFWSEFDLKKNHYLVATLHRPANVDAEESLLAMLQAIAAGAHDEPVIFPVHPRTAQTLAKLEALPNSIRMVPPQGYLQFNYLVKNSRAVITDSGGITEEATVMGVPCLTLRDSTERPETISLGTNELVGTDPAKLAPAMGRLYAGAWKSGTIPPLWDGRAGERIADALGKILIHGQ